MTTDLYGRATCTSNAAPIQSLSAGTGIYTSGNVIYNNAAPLAVLDFLDSATRALVIANSDYTSNATALSQTTAALEACMGKSCYLAPGTYYTTRTLLVLGKTQMSGAGPGFSFVYGANSSASIFGSLDVGVPSVSFAGLTVGNANSKSAFDFTNVTAPRQGPYGSIFQNLELWGGQSHAFATTSDFENTFISVDFKTLNLGNGAQMDGNKDVFITCSFGPFGDASAIGIKTRNGGHFISCNGLYFSAGKQPAKWAEFGGPSAEVTVYPRVLMENCNFEDARVTSISLVQTPSYVGIFASTFQALASPIRSFIDNVDAAAGDFAGGLNIDMRGCRFFNTAGYNATLNPTSSEIISQFNAGPVLTYFSGGGVGSQQDVYIKVQRNGIGSTVSYRVYSQVSAQPVVQAYPGTASELTLATYNSVSQSGFAFNGQLAFLCSTLAAGTSVITLSTTPVTRRMCFITANTAPTQLQRLSGDTYSNINGVMMYIMFGDSQTTIVNNYVGSGTKFSLKSGADATPTAGEVYSFMFTDKISGGAWRQI